MTQRLTAPNASDLEQSLDDAAAARFDSMQFPIRTLGDPMSCPASHLPWLAWAYSVDVWNSAWPVEVKRQVISASVAVHRRKGTVASVRTALAAIGFTTEIDEWFDYEGEPYTMRVDAHGEQIYHATPAGQLALFDLIDAQIEKTKPVRVHYALRVKDPTESTDYGRCGAFDQLFERAEAKPAIVPGDTTASLAIRSGYVERQQDSSELAFAREA